MSRRRRYPVVSARLRRGRISDLDGLIALEQELFTSHLISRRSFQRFLASPRAVLIVAEEDNKLAGYALALYRRRSKLARLYSIGVIARLRGRGIARRLLAAAEEAAAGRHSLAMRLEVRENDPAAIALYETSGYHRFDRRTRYYDKRTHALRFEKPLRPGPPQDRL